MGMKSCSGMSGSPSNSLWLAPREVQASSLYSKWTRGGNVVAARGERQSQSMPCESHGVVRKHSETPLFRLFRLTSLNKPASRLAPHDLIEENTPSDSQH